MNRNLNISLLQMPVLPADEALIYLKKAVETLMANYIKPEIVIGAEFGLALKPELIPGKLTEYFSAIAKEHGIYFIPCTMAEAAPELPDGKFYNTCCVFGPDGSIVAKYRKQVPFRPAEKSVAGDKQYCIFEIPEKNAKIGLIICYDQFFPEISRTLSLMGAEIILCPALEPMEFHYIPDIIPRVRALENECYFVWTCSTGIGPKITYCGGSIIAGPEGEVVYKCGEQPALVTKTIDLDAVTRKRYAGIDQHLNSMRTFHIDYPFAGKVETAPIFDQMPPLPQTTEAFQKRLMDMGIGTFHSVEG
ncbi:carbon-nitrogen hydrolase family protein [uncultured Clostridium sp.]|uniref:carbon-nitrogen hydrolase family protein n=1 Tax=uncultured Clostridium sp. TaxID=59620 RepID=UPI0025CF69D0|nr:carbon-nitrogen hydrolase family protein [uncultured Clostridium sp.]